MESSELENIQATKPQIIVDSGFASNPQDALGKLRDFAIRIIIFKSYRGIRKSRSSHNSSN